MSAVTPGRLSGVPALCPALFTCLTCPAAVYMYLNHIHQSDW
jgi:hypothetical protein